MEKFTPHDTIFSFINHTELRDSKLSSACLLHTASASVKSSTDSLRPPALSEIAEDAQEAQPENPEEERDKEPSLTGDDRRPRAAVSKYSDNHNFKRTTSGRRTLSPAHSTRTIRNTDKELPPTPPEADFGKVYSRSNYEGEHADNRASLDERFSFQSTRPATRDYQSSYEYKPKVKLGPRPSTDSAIRSHTLDSPRPVSTLPSSIRVSTRKAASAKQKSRHPRQSSHDMSSSKMALSPPLPIMPIQTPDASHSNLTSPITPTRPSQPKSPAITPEKRRLMKALQLRQKQLAAQALKSKFSIEATLVESEPGKFSIEPTPIKPESGKRFTIEPTPIESESGKRFTNEPAPIESKSGKRFSIEPTPIEAESRKGEADVETMVGPVEMSKEFRESETTTSESWEESEVVQVFIDDSTKSNFSNIESSPISVLEPSEGQSTQASSITDEEISKVGSKTLVWEPANQTGENDGISSQSPAADDHAELDHPDILASVSLADDTATFAELVDPEAVPLPPADESEIQDLSPQRNSLREEFTPESLTRLIPQIQPPEQNVERLLNEVEGDPNATRPSTSETSHRSALGELLTGREKTVSLKRASTPENSEDHFLSDDSFMEELRSATVQEAKPISVSVSKSPIAPVFPRRPSDQWPNDGENNTRSVSNPVGHVKKEDQVEIPSLAPPYLSSRSFSAGNVQPQQASAMLLKKVGVSSGISQRIKALEQLSTRPTSPSSQGQSSINAAGTSPAFVSFRKVTLKPPQSKTDFSEGMSNRIRPRMPPPLIASSFSAAHPNENDKSRIAQVESKFQKSQSDSISVTATIIRDPDSNVMELCRSPLVVEHQPGKNSPAQSPLKPPRSRFASPRSVSSSSTERRSETPQATRRDSLASKRSVTSGRGGSEADLARSTSDTSVNGVNGHDGSKEEKKESRKNRLFKRMSGISSASRRSIVQALNPSMKEGPIVEHHETVYETPKVMAAFGDVNIQFPDTLVSSPSHFFPTCTHSGLMRLQLWKRRDMKINERGILVLSQSKADNVSDCVTLMSHVISTIGLMKDTSQNSKVVTKQYPLSDFYPPYIPDQDRQELPNSKLM